MRTTVTLDEALLGRAGALGTSFFCFSFISSSAGIGGRSPGGRSRHLKYASAGSGTTSAIANPDGTLLAHQPYGEAGLLIAEVDLALATGFLASRCRS